MTREFLEGFGLGRDAVDAIMAENGRSIESLKARCAEAERKANELGEDIRQAEKRAVELEHELADGEARFVSFLDAMIARATAEAGFSSKAAMQSAQALMREEAEDGRDIFAALDTLRESDPGAFSVKITEKPYFTAPPQTASVGHFDSVCGFTRRRI